MSGSVDDVRAVIVRIGEILVAFVLLASGVSSAAQLPSITVSTNNTPQDRRVLEAISREIFQRLGFDFQVTSLPSERSLHAANRGDVDGEGLRVGGLSALYPNLVQVPEPFMEISFVAFASRDDIRLNKGWESLRPHSVAFITGWKMFEAHAAGSRLVTRVDTPEQMFRMLDSRRIDLALYTRADGIALARSMGFPSIKPLSPALQDVQMYLYLHKRHRDLVERLAQTLRQMKADGSYERILASTAVEP